MVVDFSYNNEVDDYDINNIHVDIYNSMRQLVVQV